MKNIEADNLLQAFSKMLNKSSGIVGYALAKNVRLLKTELTEYQSKKEEIFKKYGEEEKGNFVIKKESDGFKKYFEEMKQYDDIEVNVELMKVSSDDIINSGLTGEEMLILSDYMEVEDGIQ